MTLVFPPVRPILRSLALLVILTGLARAETVTVAVAANFLTTAQDLSRNFEAETGDNVALVHGSTGKLYAQIRAGAPIDVFLSADALRPARLAVDGFAPPGQRMTYAFGRLVLVIGSSQSPGTLNDVLRRDLVLAIADPAIAPYGAAAVEVLRAIRGEDWQRRLVLGESVGQAFAFVATGNAAAGLVALSQANEFQGELRAIPVPEDLYAPIAQDAVLLTRGAGNPAAVRFFAFLATDTARAIIEIAGYGVPE